jgi:hypothetical protein
MPLLPAPTLSAGEYKVSGGESRVSRQVGLPHNLRPRSKPKNAHDSNETFDVDEFPKDDDPIANGDYTNPMHFPVCPDHKEPSYPGRPLLRLSAGYGSATVRCC